MTMDSKLKIGVVGLGKMGIMHACLLNTLPNVKVAALCDKSRLMRIIAKRTVQGAVVTDDLANFAGLDLDAVFILTPIPIHYRLIKDIYGSNITKNVFVEKTLTSQYSRSEELCNLAQNGGVNMVGYMKRFGVTFNHVKTLLTQQALGDLVSFEGYAFSSDFADAPEGSTVSKARGGTLEDLGSHVVDVALWCFDELNVVSAHVNSRISVDSEDDVSFGVSGPDGLTGKFEVSWRKAGYRMPEFGLTIHGTKGSLSVNDDAIRLELNGAEPKNLYRTDLNDNVGYLLGGPEYYREDKHFIDCVVSGESTKSSFKSALKVDYLLDQVRRKSN